jgi:tRNA-specific 2-thiouridylase
MKRVVVGLSGGVDSSVAAYLLQQQGYEVIGLFMKNWKDESVTISDECPWLEDSNDAMMVADALSIPYQVIDLSEQYKERIVDYMFREYARGNTPNPDILCNREIKFDVFSKVAFDLGADYIATGHYCRKSEETLGNHTVYKLLSGVDETKDQSYFLCQLSQDQLKKSLFPIGHLKKSEVREIAAAQGLVTAEKKDSQGLCFIGKVKLPTFLQQQLAPKEGKIVKISNNSVKYNASPIKVATEKEQLLLDSKKINYEVSDGEVVGNHQGAHFFTVGQRKGLAVGGSKEPLFVLQTDVNSNIVYVGEGKDHRGLYRNVLFVEKDEIHWVREDLKLAIGDQLAIAARVRYRQALKKAMLYNFEEGLYVAFSEPISAITQGQFVAWYIEEELVGSGVIS